MACSMLGFQIIDTFEGPGTWYNKDSDDWAGQSDNKQMALGTFVDEYIYNKNGTGELRYAGGGVG